MYRKRAWFRLGRRDVRKARSDVMRGKAADPGISLGTKFVGLETNPVPSPAGQATTGPEAIGVEGNRAGLAGWRHS
jgi:hypothetical protein